MQTAWLQKGGVEITRSLKCLVIHPCAFKTTLIIFLQCTQLGLLLAHGPIATYNYGIACLADTLMGYIPLLIQVCLQTILSNQALRKGRSSSIVSALAAGMGIQEAE